MTVVLQLDEGCHRYEMIDVYVSWYDWSWYYYSCPDSGSALVSVCCSARVGEPRRIAQTSESAG